MDPDALFGGWGLKTISKEDGVYNPIEYPNGTVWPHDNSLMAHGPYRYGYGNLAPMHCVRCPGGRLLLRLPWIFAGYDRVDPNLPAEYSTASRPQAWGSGTYRF